MVSGPDMRYYVHASTHAARAQQEYLRAVGKGDAGWWAFVLVLTIFVIGALWFFTR